MAENTYVLLDLVSIKVNTRTINNKTIVFCESITIKPHTQEDNTPIDWSNIIIGDPTYYSNITDNKTINISTLSENNGEYSVVVNPDIGLWSVILFETVKNGDEYTTLNNITGESGGIGGTGIVGTNIEEIYETDSPYTGNECVNYFLENVFNMTNYNGCIFINNDNCGLFLNISPIMFNTQHNLKSIALTNTITYIDSNKRFGEVGVFSDCINLESANIPIYLDNYFEYNNNAYEPKKTRIVPSYYLYNCNKLNNISIPDGIHNIEYGAFYGCDNVETINIPQSVVSIGSASLVTVNRSDKRYINVIGNGTPNNIQFLEESVGYDKKPDKDGEKQYIENDVIISIDNRAEVKLSDSLLSENSSFVKNISTNSKIYINCSTITGTKFKTNNQGQQKYNGGFVNTKFNTIYIGPSVESICNFAFYKVTGTNLIIDNANVLATNYTDNSKDDSLDENKHGDVYLVKTPFVKSNFNSIHILNCGSIGQYALHTLRTGELKFFENEYSYDINSEDKIINTTLLKTLGDYAFYNSTFGSITIPSTVTNNDPNNTNISNTSFLQTAGSLVLNCDISKYVTVIDETDKKHTGILVNSNFGEIAFNYNGSIPINILYENKSINSIKLGEGITGILGKAFYLCTNLTNTLSLPVSLKLIDETSFIGCMFTGFESLSDTYQIDNSGMYLLEGSTIVLFANKHADIQTQIVENTFSIIEKDNITGIGDYAFAYAFSDYANSNVYAVTIPDTINKFGRNIFYNCTITRITIYSGNIPKFDKPDADQHDIEVYYIDDFKTGIKTDGSFSDLESLREVYVGYTAGVLLYSKLESIPVDNDGVQRTNFLHNTLRNSYLNGESDISKITIYVYEGLVETYTNGDWGAAGYKISGIPQGVQPPKPEPPVGNDDEYDADVDDPEGEEWPGDGGNGDITTEEDYIPPIDNGNSDTDNENDNWIITENNRFKVPITQLGIPSIKVYGCRLDLLNPTYLEGEEPENINDIKIIDQFGNVNFSALNYLKFNKVSDKTQYGSEDDTMLKLYMGDYGNNFLIVFTVTGIDNFDATTKLFTSGVEYATHRESNWLKTEIVRITKKPESTAYYVVLLCTCLKLQNKDNYNCRNAIVSVNYGSQMLDGDKTTTKIRVIQHKTELRLSNNSREINITDLPVLFCKDTKRTTFTGNFFIGFPKNFWSIGNTISNGGTSANKNKLREYINDYFRILYDKEKIKIVGQTTKIDGLDYTYTFDVADDKYANIKETGSTTSTLKKFSLCEDKLSDIHEEYYYVNFKIENLKTSLAGGGWNISIYNIGEPAEMLNIQAIEDKTDIPSIVLFDENVSVYGKQFTGEDVEEDTHELRNDVCYSIYNTAYVALNYFIPIAITNLPIVSNKIIYPEAEVVDLCVDSSCIIDCGNAGNTLFGTGGGDLFNNYRGVLTLNTNIQGQSKLVFPISSSKLKHTALSSIKYTCSNTQNAGLYAYFGNEDDPVTKCSCTKNITKIKYTGSKSDSDILENTTTFLYDFNTGVSCINQTTGGVSELLYNNFLSINNNDNNNTLEVKNINTSNSDIAYHNENYVKENNLCFSSNLKFVYDKFYNVLAPLYPYSEYTTKYKTDYSDSSQILVNQYYDATYTQLVGNSTASIYKNTLYTYIENDSEQTATGSTYYCTSTPGIIITAEEGNLTDDKFNVYTGQAYLVTDASNNKITIGVNTVTDTLNYTMESINNKYNNTDIYSSASTVTLLPLYKITVDASTVSAHSEINSDDLKTRYSNELTHGLVVNVIGTANISFTPNNKSDSIVYKDKNDNKYYDINNNEFDKTMLYTCSIEVTRYDKYVYISDSTVSSFTIPNNGATYNYTDVFGDNSTITLNAFNILSSTADVPANKILEHGDPIYDNNGNINTTPEIKEELFETNSLNIGNALLSDYDKSVDQTRFRQVFLNFYYSILDNGVKTKVYADNTNGILMHLRLINNYNKPVETLPVFTVTNMNIFNFSFNSNITNNIFDGSQVMTPVYPTIKV